MSTFTEQAARLKKPRPHLLVKRDQRAALKTEDAKQRKLCHLRSGGRCEVIEVRARPEQSALVKKRCHRRVSQNHHLLGGHGRRNVGDSILAAHRLDTCDLHHAELHHKVLVPVNLDHQYDALLVEFERVE